MLKNAEQTERLLNGVSIEYLANNPKTRREFNELIGTNITEKHWSENFRWSDNEHGSRNFLIAFEGFKDCGEPYNLDLELEVVDDKIEYIFMNEFWY